MNPDLWDVLSAAGFKPERLQMPYPSIVNFCDSVLIGANFTRFEDFLLHVGFSDEAIKTTLLILQNGLKTTFLMFC